MAIDAVIDIDPVGEIGGTLELIVVAALGLEFNFGGVTYFHFACEGAPREGRQREGEDDVFHCLCPSVAVVLIGYARDRGLTRSVVVTL